LKYKQKYRSFFQYIYTFCFLVFGFITSRLFAQTDSSKAHVVFPKPISQGKFYSSLGISVTVVPRLVVEEGVLQLPMLDLRARYGLSDNIFISGRANLVYITNQVSLGAGWAHSFGKISISVADNFAYWFGFADFQGFNSTAMGLTNNPNITIGIALDDLHLSLGGEALFTISQHTYFGSASVGRVNPEFVGYAVTVSLEEELWRKNYFLFGLRFQYSLPMYQTWLAFSTSYRWALFPELFIGYEL
jgi:hypothetical protein